MAHVTSGSENNLFAPDTFTSLFPLSPSLYSKVETVDCKSAVKAMIVVHTARSYSQISTADRSVAPRSVAIATPRKVADINQGAVANAKSRLAEQVSPSRHTETSALSLSLCLSLSLSVSLSLNLSD